MRDEVRGDLRAGEHAGQIDPRRFPGGEPPGGRTVPPHVGLELRYHRRRRDHGGMEAEERERQAVAPGGACLGSGKPPVDRERIPRAADDEAPENDGENVIGGPDEHRPAVEERGPKQGRKRRRDRRPHADGEHPEEPNADKKKGPQHRARPRHIEQRQRGRRPPRPEDLRRDNSVGAEPGVEIPRPTPCQQYSEEPGQRPDDRQTPRGRRREPKPIPRAGCRGGKDADRR